MVWESDSETDETEESNSETEESSESSECLVNKRHIRRSKRQRTKTTNTKPTKRQRTKTKTKPNQRKTKRRKVQNDEPLLEFTADGYIVDDRVVHDPEYDPSNPDGLFKSSYFGNLLQGLKPSEDNWKEGLSKSQIKLTEPELKRIRKNIKDETPTIPKILRANITKNDKKKCIKLYDQYQNMDMHTAAYDQKEEEINNIIRKGSRHTKAEINQLEKTEEKLNLIASPPDNLKNQIFNLDASEHVKGIIYGQYLEMLTHDMGSQAYNAIREDIEWSVRLPHNRSHDFLNLGSYTNKELNEYYSGFLEKMDQELYGMNHIKLRMLHIINDRATSGGSCGRNIALTGAPGTGKTAIGKALAKVLNVPFEKISVGGMEDASILKGSDRVYNSASPSIVLQILARMKSSSGIIMFDEIDKLGETPKGKEVQYALLHIADYVHNKEFRDNYLNKYPHDFSKILFIYNMNTIETLDPAFRNRLDIMETKPYNHEEKIEITQNYVLPRALKKIGLDKKSVTLSSAAAKNLVMNSGDDPGVRTIEKAINDIAGKINMYNSVVLKDKTTGNLDLGYNIPKFKFPLVITPKILKSLVGK